MTNKKTPSSTEITKLDQFNNVQEMTRWAQTVLDSGLLPNNLSTPEEVITIVQHGKELGITPHIALNNIHVISGRPTVSSAMLGSLLKRRGIEIIWDEDFVDILDGKGEVQKTPAGAKNRRTTVHFYWWSKNLNREMDAKFSVTWVQMEIAGYVTKDNWKKYPKEMLRARCISYAVRALFPEVLSGYYTDLEINDISDNSEVSMTEEGDLNINLTND